MNLLQLTEKVDGIFSQVNLSKPNNLPKYDDIESLKVKLAEHKAQMNQERTLKIGIVGRVKAGKSSLLNMLFFNGNDILPKAATPMTAALTRLCHGEKRRAVIECFTDKDIQEIRADAKEYNDSLREETKKKRAELEANNPNRRKPYTPEEMDERAERAAKDELSDSPKLGAAIQLAELNRAGSRPTVTEIKADTNEALMRQLQDYVGANGKYTAHTKSVVLYLPEEGLKEIEVVDTPGVNDPVKSREQRTNDFLKECHVILAVSPASNFLDDKDSNFIERAMTLGGVTECYLVGSRADDTLLEKYYSAENQDPFVLISSLNEELGLLGRSEQSSWKFVEDSKTKETKEVRRFIPKGFSLSSSVAFSLLNHNKRRLDEVTEHASNQLKEAFGEVFIDHKRKQSLLETLSGKTQIEQVFEELRKQKQPILDAKDRNFENPIKYALKEYLTTTKDYARNQLLNLEKYDMESVKKRAEFLKSISSIMQYAADKAFEYSVDELNHAQKVLRDKNTQLCDHFSTAGTKQNKTKKVEERRTETVKKSGVFGWLGRATGLGGYEERSYYVTVDKHYVEYITTPIADSIDKVRQALESNLQKLADSERIRWGNIAENNVGQSIFDKLSEQVGGKDATNPREIQRIMSQIIGNLPSIKFSLPPIPEKFKQRVTLNEYEGQRFVDEATQYMSGLEEEINLKIDSDIQKCITLMRRERVGEKFTIDLLNEAENLTLEIQDKENNMKKYQQLIECADALNAEIKVDSIEESV